MAGVTVAWEGALAWAGPSTADIQWCLPEILRVCDAPAESAGRAGVEAVREVCRVRVPRARPRNTLSCASTYLTKADQWSLHGPVARDSRLSTQNLQIEGEKNAGYGCCSVWGDGVVWGGWCSVGGMV